MGVSTDAILFYGLAWEDELDLLARHVKVDRALEWEEVVARKRGHRNPWDDLDSTTGSYEECRKRVDDWDAANRVAIDAWFDTKAAINAEFGVDIDWHCSDDCRMPYLFVASTRVRAYRGTVVVVDATSLFVLSEWADMLKRFADELEIDVSEAKGPGWLLVSHWG